jgi:ankyrin repeat protein
MIAACMGHLEIVRRLLAHPGIECDKVSAEGDSALMIAADSNHPDVVSYLLDAGAQVNLADGKDGWTALMYAAGEGRVEVARRLLAQPGIDCDKVNAEGSSALMIAAGNNHLDVVGCLLAAGAQVNLASANDGWTALMYAAGEGHVAVVRRLLAQPGIDCDKVNADGNSALMIAADEYHPDVVDRLLDAGAQVNLANPKDGETALMIASRSDDVEIVRRLLAHPRIECDKANADGDSALMIAADNNHLDVVGCLLDAGAQVNLANEKDGWTALIYAAGEGHLAVVRRLLDQPGIEPDKLDADGDSALAIAAGNNRPAVVDCLLAAGAQVDFSGELKEAVRIGSAALVEVLFRHGAQRSDITVPLTGQPDWFVAAIEDLAAELDTSAPALPGPAQAQAFFSELSDRLASHQETGEDPLQWLTAKGLRCAYAQQLTAMLNGAQSPWTTAGASRQQKMVYCLSAISRLPALGAAGEMLKLYQDAGISAAAVERLGGVVSSQLNAMASLAADMLAGMGSEMTGALVDGCISRTNMAGDVNGAELMASLTGQGYCLPIAQAIVASWQEVLSAPGLNEQQMSLAVNGTLKQLVALLQAQLAALAPALFAQALLRHLASHAPIRQLSAMQADSHDEALHAQFQIQCDQLRQFCEQLLAAPASSAMTGSSPCAGTAPIGQAI